MELQILKTTIAPHHPGKRIFPKSHKKQMSELQLGHLWKIKIILFTITFCDQGPEKTWVLIKNTPAAHVWIGHVSYLSETSSLLSESHSYGYFLHICLEVDLKLFKVEENQLVPPLPSSLCEPVMAQKVEMPLPDPKIHN